MVILNSLTCCKNSVTSPGITDKMPLANAKYPKEPSNYYEIFKKSIVSFTLNYGVPFVASIPSEIAIKDFWMNFLSNSNSKLALPNFCAEKVFGKRLQEILHGYVNQPVRNLRELSASFFPTNLFVDDFSPKPIDVTEAIVGVSLEELISRELIQNQLLKNIPKKILARWSPDHQHLIDHKIAMISRVVLSSTIFALIHTGSWDCSPGGGLSYPFLGGILLGSLKEITGSTILTTAVHFECNWHPVLNGVTDLLYN